jgi:hypothetical protein
MAWHLRGTYFENCNCDVVCPCNSSSLALPADNDRCVLVLAFHVEEGEVDGIDVSNLSLTLVADTPKQMTDGHWRVGVVMDDAATNEQARALRAVFSGEQGGPMAAFAPLFGEQLGLETVPIEYSNGGTTHRVKAGELFEIEVEDFVPHGSSEPTRLVGVVHPVNTTLTLARATRSRGSAFGVALSGRGKNGHAAPFAWSA